jgi:hypothetical protein
MCVIFVTTTVLEIPPGHVLLCWLAVLQDKKMLLSYQSLGARHAGSLDEYSKETSNRRALVEIR